jgi:hypothetical protein
MHDGWVTADVAAAREFVSTHGRLLDRCRFELVTAHAPPHQAFAALDAHRNTDGGYGWGLEPDLRAGGSQPVGALHALEVWEDAAPATSPRAAALCDWLASTSLGDGGLPFALPIPDPAGCSPVWTQADTTTSSLHMTAAVAALAHWVGRHDRAVGQHPWLAAATRYCLERIAATDRPGHALELRYCLWLLDAVAEVEPDATPQLQRLAALLPASGAVHVEGGADDELMRPLDFSPRPDRPLRARFPAGVIAADLERLANEQQADGGWGVDWVAASPAAALEWRGWATVRAVTILRANGVVA